MKVAIRLVLMLLALAGGVVAVEMKKEDVRQVRETKVTTILSELMEKGAPVHMQPVAQKDFSLLRKVSLSPCRSSYCFSIARSERGQFRPGSSIYAGSEVIGRVVSVAAEPSLASGLYEVRADLRTGNAERRRVVGEVISGKHRNVMVIPNSAVVFVEGKSQVYVVGGDGNPQLTEVQLGETNGFEYQVKQGLSPGQLIVVDGKALVARFRKLNVLAEGTGS